jgi:hypothetical protein
MRTYILAAATAALFALPGSAFSQGVEFGPGGVRIYHHNHGYAADRGECRELRAACTGRAVLGVLLERGAIKLAD